MASVTTGVRTGTLDASEAADLVGDDRAGAVVTFVGVVRDHDGGRSVTGIDYSAHPTAEDELAAIGAEMAARTGIHGVVLLHRVGSLAVGDVALVACVSGEHRHEAFEACSDAVEAVKARVPIWKKQAFADGTSQWSNLP